MPGIHSFQSLAHSKGWGWNGVKRERKKKKRHKSVRGSLEQNTFSSNKPPVVDCSCMMVILFVTSFL